MKKRTKRLLGFTLTELIIVIVIIGILAAVLIPTITRYVERAKLSNDKSDARNITMLLSLEAIDENVSYFNTTHIIQTALLNGYSLQARAKGYYFCYNYLDNKVEVLSNSDLNINALPQDTFNDNPINKLRNISGKYVIDQADTGIAYAVNIMSDFLNNAIAKAAAEKTSVEVAMTSLYVQINNLYPTIFEDFDPAKTLYINENGFYTTNGTTNFENVIIDQRATKLPSTTSLVNLNINANVYLPVNLKINSGDLGWADQQTNFITTNQNQTQEVKDEGFTPLPSIVPNYNKQLINVNFQYVIGDQYYDIDNQGVVVLGTNATVAIDFRNNSGGSILKDGSSFTSNHSVDSNGYSICEVKLFDKYGVIYGSGKLVYVKGDIELDIAYSISKNQSHYTIRVEPRLNYPTTYQFISVTFNSESVETNEYQIAIPNPVTEVEVVVEITVEINGTIFSKQKTITINPLVPDPDEGN